MKTKFAIATFALCAAAAFGGSTISQAQQVIYESAPAPAPTVVYLQAPVVNIGNTHSRLSCIIGSRRSTGWKRE